MDTEQASISQAGAPRAIPAPAAVEEVGVRPGEYPRRFGNRYDLLVNGCEIFPAMLEAIAQARESICFETYIYHTSDIGRKVAQALAERAAAGVDVRVVLDAFGSGSLDESVVETMESAGVQVRKFRPLSWHKLHRFNSRTHRKLLIVDGRTGFIGGVGIADEWTGDAHDSDHWRDNQYRIHGPVVADLQRVFFSHWDDDDRPGEGDRRFFPELQREGTVTMQVIAAEPVDGPSRILHGMKDAIGRSRERLGIVTPYFMPEKELIDALKEACHRGVEVRALTCVEMVDWDIVRNASRHRWGDLLQAGVRILEYKPTLIHAKAIIVDDREVLVGSANFDCRSCNLNDEANLLIEDRETAERHWRMFADDAEKAEELDLKAWQDRPRTQKIKDALAHLFRDHL